MKKFIVMSLILTSVMLSTLGKAAAMANCVNIAHIGDSTTFYMRTPLHAEYVKAGFPQVIIDARGGRAIDLALHGDHKALIAVKNIKATGFTGCWVIAMGTNDTANTAAMKMSASKGDIRDDKLIDSMMQAIGNTDKVMWVNVYLPGKHGYWNNKQQIQWNAALTRAATRYPQQLTIYDWASVAQRSWLLPDLVHYTTAGYLQRAQLIVQAATTLGT